MSLRFFARDAVKAVLRAIFRVWQGARRAVVCSAVLAVCVSAARDSVASDDMLAALAERGFAPWAEDFVGEFPYPQAPSADDLVLGDGFLIRLPRPASATQFLVVNGVRSVIVDRIGDVGELGLSDQAARGLGLAGGSSNGTVVLQIVALARPGGADANVAILPDETAGASEPVLNLPPLVAVDEALSEPVYAPPAIGDGFSFRDDQRDLTAELRENLLSQQEGQLSFQARDTPPPAEIAKPAPSRMEQPSGDLALQAGFFRNRQNALRLAQSLRDLGLPVIERSTRSSNRPGWIVMVGPFSSASQRDAAKAQGGDLLRDAFPVKAPAGS